MQYHQRKIQDRLSRNDVHVAGYEKNYMGGTYRMLNLCTKRIIIGDSLIFGGNLQSPPILP